MLIGLDFERHMKTKQPSHLESNQMATLHKPNTNIFILNGYGYGPDHSKMGSFQIGHSKCSDAECTVRACIQNFQIQGPVQNQNIWMFRFGMVW